MSTQDAAPVGFGTPSSDLSHGIPRAGGPLASRARRRRAGALSLAVLGVVVAPLLAGCGAIGSRDESGGVGGDPGVVGEAPPLADGGGSDGEDAGGDAPAEDRELVITGSLYVTVEDPLDAADEAARIVERAGGRVDGRRESAPRDSGTGGSGDGSNGAEFAPEYSYDGYGGYFSFGAGGGAVLELRIPSARLTETLDELAALGEREELVLSSDDVTFERRDLTARISALESSVTRLLALQDAAADLNDLIALESAISDRQAELESLQAQERYYEDQISLSTITLTLGSEDVAPVDEPDSFWTGLTTGWDALLAFVGGALVVAGVLLPWLIVLGLLALVAWAVLRGARARRARSTAGSEPTGCAQPGSAQPGGAQPGGASATSPAGTAPGGTASSTVSGSDE
ncbi:hypothetical protein GCM10009792_02370 [Microcella alkalica]|uniref:DUF4349 domain-containing protein n=1 Tax=Microcella alkalica TaxID=355930 RepID=A0A839EED1_9MICO|nr:DUF4349 domain-containing protein [Microcella alkalica]MBA8847978.1 hypothetical protein [Microcella alkalica]